MRIAKNASIRFCKFGQPYTTWNKGKKGLQIPWNKGKTLSDLHKFRVSISKTGKSRIGTPHSEETKLRISKSHIGKIPWNKGIPWSDGVKNKLKSNWSDIEYKNLRLKKQFDLWRMKKNKQEESLEILINEVRPGEFRYVGDGKVWIAGKNPDFIHINDNKVIEYFGNFWHKPEDETIRKAHFSVHNFDCLIVWEDELKNKKELLEKILYFC